MGKLTCLKCKATAEAPTFEKADSLIDHAASSIKCSGSPDYLVWNGSRRTDEKAIDAAPRTRNRSKKD